MEKHIHLLILTVLPLTFRSNPPEAHNLAADPKYAGMLSQLKSRGEKSREELK